MKIGHFLAALALSFCLLVPQFAWAVDYVAGPGSDAAPGQIIGTPTNDNANAGNVGFHLAVHNEKVPPQLAIRQADAEVGSGRFEFG